MCQSVTEIVRGPVLGHRMPWTNRLLSLIENEQGSIVSRQELIGVTRLLYDKISTLVAENTALSVFLSVSLSLPFISKSLLTIRIVQVFVSSREYRDYRSHGVVHYCVVIQHWPRARVFESMIWLLPIVYRRKVVFVGPLQFSSLKMVSDQREQCLSILGSYAVGHDFANLCNLFLAASAVCHGIYNPSHPDIDNEFDSASLLLHWQRIRSLASHTRLSLMLAERAFKSEWN